MAPFKFKFKVLFILVLVAITLLSGGIKLQPSATTAPATVYIEPSLLTSQADSLAVIVTAADSEAAAEAVTRLGGQVSSDLWLINAVSASLPAGQLEALAATPGLVSIVRNKGVEPADQPLDWDGWMTDRRQKGGTYAMVSNLRVPVTFLPDGGFVAVGEHGDVLIVNADGSERARVQLEGDHFENAPVIGPDSAIYLVRPGEKTLHALSADGSLAWTFSNSEPFPGGAVVDPSGATVYTVDKKRRVIALDALTGRELWRFTVQFEKAGDVKRPLTMGPDGTLYQLFSGDPDRLYALTPLAGASRLVKWSFVAEKDSLQPLVGRNGLIYLPNKNKAVAGARRQPVRRQQKPDPLCLQPGRLAALRVSGRPLWL